jgi:tetratricopeptide (TPR) repeat protein
MATLAAYAPIWDSSFVNYDDTLYVTQNPRVQEGLTLESIRWAFTSFVTANWHPLTWLSLQTNAQLFGVEPRSFHLTNLALHLVSTLLLFWVFRQMTGAVWPSAFVAALFALHPLHVESVAWISERKDVLSTLFWMLALWAYARYAQQPGLGRYFLVMLFFALGLLAKPMVVTLPCVLLLLDFWPLGRFSFGARKSQRSGQGAAPVSLASLVVEKLRLFSLAIGSSYMTLLAQEAGGALISTDELPIQMRLANALVSYGRYLAKAVWPRGLTVFYPYLPDRWFVWEAIGAGVLLTAITLLAVWQARRLPYLIVGWLWYLGTLVPMIGLVQVGGQALADRYTYVPLIGVFLMLSWGLADLVAWGRLPRWVPAAAAASILLACLAVTWNQVGYWHDSLALWQHALEVKEKNNIAHNNLGLALYHQAKAKEGRVPWPETRAAYLRAVEHYRRATEINPGHTEAYYNWGLIVEKLPEGGPQRALPFFQKAVALNPAYVDAQDHVGLACTRLGLLDKAIEHFTVALEVQPESAVVHNHLGLALAQQGKLSEAIAQFQLALELNRNYAEAHYNLGAALARQGKGKEADYHLSEAERLRARKGGGA